MQKSSVLAALAGGVLLASPAAVAQSVASLPAGQTSQLVFLDQEGISSTGRNILRTIASDARGARTVELLGAPPYAEAVKKQTATRVCNPDALEALPENDVWKGDGGGAITSFPIVTTNAALKCGAVPPPYPGRFDDARNSMTGCAARPTIR